MDRRKIFKAAGSWQKHGGSVVILPVQIWEWTKGFCERTRATGQLCFDYMKSVEDGKLYAFECNPRASTILLNFYNNPAFAQALFDGQVQILGYYILHGRCHLLPPSLVVLLRHHMPLWYPESWCMSPEQHEE